MKNVNIKQKGETAITTTLSIDYEISSILSK